MTTDESRDADAVATAELVAWLRKQIAEDRRTAKQLLHPSAYRAEGVLGLALDWGRIRVLAECDAKERVIAQCVEWDSWGPVDGNDYDRAGDGQAVECANVVLRLMASPYSDRPGYREERER